MKSKITLAGLVLGGAAFIIGPAVAHEVIHANHAASHYEGDGHIVIEHDGHMDHLHDGHLHSMHDGHADEHVIAVSAANPAGENRGSHDGVHLHSADDGHPEIQHGDHFDHLHDGHLHHMHGDHTDEHGAIKVM